MSNKTGSKKHLRKVPGPLRFWLTVSPNTVTLFPSPSKLPPLVEPDGLAAIGYRDSDEQEKGYRYLAAHKHHTLSGFVQHYEKAIKHREIVVVEAGEIASLLA